MNRPIFYIVDEVAINIHAIALIESVQGYGVITMNCTRRVPTNKPVREVLDDITRLQGSHDHDYFDKVQTCIECALYNRP